MKTIPSRSRQAQLGAPFVLVLLSFLPPPVLAAERVTSGKWESAMTTAGETRTVSYCISPAEATSMNGDSRTGRDFAEKKAGSRCTIKSYEIRGDTIAYAVACGARLITDTTRFHGDTAEGVKTIAGEGVTVTTTVKSRRTGTCP